MLKWFLSICLSQLVLISASAANPKYTMTVASVAPSDSPWSALLMMYKETIEKKSNGEIKVKVMLGGALGDENEAVEKCHRGQIQAVGATTGALALKVPEINLVELPFLFRNEEEADKVIDETITAPMEKFFSDRKLVLGFWNENGFRNFGSKDFVVKSPKDLKGKKMRSQESPVHIAMYKAFGASPTPIPVTEVPQALGTGNVDGFDQAALYAIAAGWQKSIKHFTISQHIYQPAAIVFNKAWFDKLPKNLQKLLVDEGRVIQGKGRRAVRSISNDLIEILKSEKINVHTLTTAERAVFAEASKPVYVTFRKTFGKKASDLLDKVEAHLKQIRGEK